MAVATAGFQPIIKDLAVIHNNCEDINKICRYDIQKPGGEAGVKEADKPIKESTVKSKSKSNSKKVAVK